jgi:predicted amidophosphoribosyltransferase
LIHLLKCKGIIRIVKPLDYLLLELCPKIMTSLYLVPLHQKKLEEREFNHYREVPNLCHFSRSSPPCWWTTFYYRCDCK